MFTPVLAAEFNADGGFWITVISVFAALILFSFIMMLTQRYKRCPSNRVLVIFGWVGKGNSAKCIHGGAAFVWPLLQDYQFLTLEPIQIEVPLKDALSIENIRVNVPSVFTVAIGTEPEFMTNAAIRLLGLNHMQIKKQAEDIIFGQLRQVIASMKIEDINRDRDSFLHNIQKSLVVELKKIGLVLINVNITDITDESGYIEAIGQKAASTAIQQARGDVAEQEKIGEVRVAEAERDKLVQVANATKLREIGIRDAQREQLVRVAQIDKEQQVGEQSAKFEQQTQVKDAERQMRIQIANANALAISGENQSQAAIVASQAELQVKQAEAYKLGETRKRESEAAVLEAQNRAMAKAATAQAERIEAERRAAVEAPAKAEKAKMIVDAQAQAEKLRIEAEGQASAIYAKLEAEAKGNFEILAKKGDGLRRIIEACGGSNPAYQMMMLEHLDNLAETASQAISRIKFDKIVVWEGGQGNGQGQGATAGFLQSLTRTLPPMMQVIRDIGGVDIGGALKLPAESAEASASETPVSTAPAPTPASGDKGGDKGSAKSKGKGS